MWMKWSSDKGGDAELKRAEEYSTWVYERICLENIKPVKDQ